MCWCKNLGNFDSKEIYQSKLIKLKLYYPNLDITVGIKIYKISIEKKLINVNQIKIVLSES